MNSLSLDRATPLKLETLQLVPTSPRPKANSVTALVLAIGDWQWRIHCNCAYCHRRINVHCRAAHTLTSKDLLDVEEASAFFGAWEAHLLPSDVAHATHFGRCRHICFQMTCSVLMVKQSALIAFSNHPFTWGSWTKHGSEVDDGFMAFTHISCMDDLLILLLTS